ncbi:potassium-transporting ATPase subunit KdpA [Labrys neptuniae]
MPWLEQIVFLALVIGLAWPASRYLVCVFEGRRTWLDPLLRPVEAGLYRCLGVRPQEEMSARTYILAFVLFGLAGTALLFILLLVQQVLPGGPDATYLTTPISVDLAANTAISFATTTTWQAYGGETTMAYLTQTLGLASQNFLAGAAGLAVGVAFIRGFARENAATLGNFWVDMTRAVLWVLLPLSVLGGLVLIAQGVPMNLAAYTRVTTLEGAGQTIAQGPVAALEFIKNLGTNGGGFFNANGAHPFENPTPLTNILALLAIAVLPASLPLMFGQMTGRRRAGWVLLAVMAALFITGLVLCDAAESAAPSHLAEFNLIGGNMEGKEVRFGPAGSALAAVVTSNGATGSYNSMHDSYQPLGVAVPLVNMLLGELVFGGLGTGLYSMVMTALIAVFLGGLMIGRTPSYLGKRLGVEETKLVMLYALITPAVVLGFGCIAVMTQAGRAGLTTNSGAHGLTEILYAYASAMANNGQVMAGLSANSLFYNTTTALAMLAGRFGPAALALMLAGRCAAQGRLAPSSANLPDDSLQFGLMVLAVIVVVGALSFLPALALGPILEGLRG